MHFDSSSTLQSMRRDGGRLVVLVRAARTGWQDYVDHLEYRAPEEVFSDASMASWVGTPVTHLHAWIDESNVDYYAKGFVRSVSRDRGDGANFRPNKDRLPISFPDPTPNGFRAEYVLAELVITDADMGERIERGEIVEASGGYSTNLETPADISKPGWHGRQLDVRINHLALGPSDWCRCGSSCSIR